MRNWSPGSLRSITLLHFRRIHHSTSKWRRIWSRMSFSFSIWATLKRWNSKSRKRWSFSEERLRVRLRWLRRKRSNYGPRSYARGTITRSSIRAISIWFFHRRSLRLVTIQSFLKRLTIATKNSTIEVRLPRSDKRQLKLKKQERGHNRCVQIRMWLQMESLDRPLASLRASLAPLETS